MWLYQIRAAPWRVTLSISPFCVSRNWSLRENLRHPLTLDITLRIAMPPEDDRTATDDLYGRFV